MELKNTASREKMHAGWGPANADVPDGTGFISTTNYTNFHP